MDYVDLWKRALGVFHHRHACARANYEEPLVSAHATTGVRRHRQVGR